MTATESRPADATLSVTKAAQVLGVHSNTVRAWSEQGRLRYYRINARGDRRYRLRDLRGFLVDAQRGPIEERAPRRGERFQPARTARGHAPPAIRPPAILDGPAPGSEARTRAIRHLADLAELTAAGRTLDVVLEGATGLIAEATGALDATVWELRSDRLVRQAGSATAGSRPSPDASSAAAHAVAQRRPVVEAAQKARPQDPPSAGLDVAVPIGTDGPWGALSVRLRALQPVDETINWLEAAAAILAATIRSNALVDAGIREVQRGEALRRVAMDMNATLNVDETLARLIDHAMAIFGADRAGIFLRRADGEILAEVRRGLSTAFVDAVRRVPAPSLSVDSALARRPLFAMNYRDDPRAARYRSAVVNEGFDTICAAPLLDGEDVLGMLNLYHDRPRPWTAVELETMAAFASQITVAVRSAQQYAQLERWAAQLQSIQHLGASLNRLTTVPEIASGIATELAAVIAHDCVRVYRLDGETLDAVAIQASDALYEGATPSALRTRIGEGITGWVAAHGISQNLPDSAIDPRTMDIPGSPAFDESMLLSPLIIEDTVLGVVVLARHGLRQFSDDDLRLLEIYASIAAQAIANVDATERLQVQSAALQRQLRGQRELLDLTESILATLDTGAVMGQIADRLGRLVRYDNLAIELIDPASGELVPLSVAGPDAPSGPTALAADSLADWVISHNEPRLVPDAVDSGPDAPTIPADRPRPEHAPAPGTSSRIVVPLRGRDGVTGLIALDRAANVGNFTTDEFELVQLFAAQVSIALQNAETHEAVEVRAQTDDLTGLLNHGSLRERLAVTAAAGATFGLIMLDLDDFKSVNDAHGHQAGDRLLRDIATAIVSAGRQTDLVFRYGGDEFAVLLPGTDTVGALQVAERIRRAIRGVVRLGARSDRVEITASIGLATFPLDGASGGDLLLAADRACFAAKRTGRDRIADAAEGRSLAGEFSLQSPTPVDSPEPRSITGAGIPSDAGAVRPSGHTAA